MSDATTRARLSAVLHGLEKAYGKVITLPEEPTLDHAVFLLLRDNWDYRKAQRALRILQKEFVDWNEVRVSSPAELRGALGELGEKDLDVRVEKIRALLAALWKERNATSLGFLKEMETESRRRLLTNLGVLSPGIVQTLLTCLAEADALLVHPGVIRMLTRVGLLDGVRSESAARKALEGVLAAEDRTTFQLLATQHAEEICQARSPRCGECAIVSLCKFKRKVGVPA